MEKLVGGSSERVHFSNRKEAIVIISIQNDEGKVVSLETDVYGVLEIRKSSLAWKAQCLGPARFEPSTTLGFSRFIDMLEESLGMKDSEDSQTQKG